MAKGMGSIRGRQSSGPFRTSGTEKWPAKMCQWLATLIFEAWTASATTAKEGETAVQATEKLEAEAEMEDTFPINQPEGARLAGGEGPPRVCDIPGGPRDFHDGGGLCSPGRWPHERRRVAEGYNWSWLRDRLFRAALDRTGGVDNLEKEVFRMATGGEEGCGLVRNESFIAEIVDILASWIEAQDLAVPGLIDVAEGQPLRLRLLRAILQAADDPDRDFLLQAETGLPVGILEPLPRTPHVFEPQEKWPLENVPWEPELAWVPNYSSTREHLEFARAKFEEEIEEGLMEKMSLETFRERFGEHSAIAALAVIVEDEENDKKRIIHDASKWGEGQSPDKVQR